MRKKELSAFSVILIAVALMVVGIAIIPLLHVRYMPSREHQQLQLNYSWPGVTTRIVEQEVTAKIEGMLSRVAGIREVNSVTRFGQGMVSIKLKKGMDPDVIRFEVATLIRQLYPHLPEGVSYPVFSRVQQEDDQTTLMSYAISANLASSKIKDYTQQHILPVLSKIKGINSVDIYGAVPYELEVRYDANACSALGIKAEDIHKAIRNSQREDVAGIVSPEKGENRITVYLQHQGDHGLRESVVRRIKEVKVGHYGERAIRVGDIAGVRLKEQETVHYFRINGQNNVTLRIIADRGINSLEVSKQVRKTMEQLQDQLSSLYSIRLVYDESEQIGYELNKIYMRSGLSILILLLLVLVTSRSWHYLFMIVITMTANLLFAFIFYYWFKVELNLFSLAGITISLGLIIDTSIIMIDHYNYYHNRKAFLAILGALLTTAGAMVIVFLLPEEQQVYLFDFAAVLLINLTVSLLISLFFIPALSEKLPLEVKRKSKQSMRWKVRCSRCYFHAIRVGYRYRWVFFVLAILLFGIPLEHLPDKLELEEGEHAVWKEWYNRTIGGYWYQDRMKQTLEPLLGGTSRLFLKNIHKENFQVQARRTRIYINATMPQGYTLRQLNAALEKMERFIGEYKEEGIDIYETRLYREGSGQIVVSFTEEAEEVGFPQQLQQEIIGKVNEIGGVFWYIYGAGDSFQNRLGADIRMDRIKITGYSYDLLCHYADLLLDSLKTNARIQKPVIVSVDRYNSRPNTEYFISFNADKMINQDVSKAEYYDVLKNQLYEKHVMNVRVEGVNTPVRLISDQTEQFDRWHMLNTNLNIGDKNIKLSELGKIEKKEGENDIYKRNQEYALYIACNYQGDSRLIERRINRYIRNINLPLGFKTEIMPPYQLGIPQVESIPFELILIVIAIIYIICAMLFESWWQPLAIVGLIPVSFIGVFLTFYSFDFSFDQGGFAAFVLLAGLVVNAGIYVINEYNILCRSSGRKGIKWYVKAFNHKIVPITLTVISTVLGLIPFVWIGNREIFWFSFAVGTMGGILFSMIALIVYLPLYMKFGEKRKKD